MTSSKLDRLWTERFLLELGVDRAKAARISVASLVHSLGAGEPVALRGEAATWCYVVDGCLVSSFPQDNRHQSVDIVAGPGCWLGEEYVVSETPHFFSTKALCATRVIHLPPSLLSEALAESPGLTLFMFKQLSLRAMRSVERLNLIKYGRSSARMIMGMCYLLEHFDRPRASASALPATNNPEYLSIPLSQQIIADYCGVSRARLSSGVRLLIEADLIQSGYKNLTFCNLNKWRRWMHELRTMRILPYHSEATELIKFIGMDSRREINLNNNSITLNWGYDTKLLALT